MICLKLTKPIKSVRLIDEPVEWNLEQTLTEANETVSESMESLAQQKKHIEQLCQVLSAITDKLNSNWEMAISNHKEQIARLSVEIARKILEKQACEGDYKIEKVIEQALADVPSGEDIQIHLNPVDIETCNRFFEQNPHHHLANYQFIADPKIGLAECRISCPKGIVNSIIDEQLEHVAELLKKE